MTENELKPTQTAVYHGNVYEYEKPYAASRRLHIYHQVDHLNRCILVDIRDYKVVMAFVGRREGKA